MGTIYSRKKIHSTLGDAFESWDPVDPRTMHSLAQPSLHPVTVCFRGSVVNAV